MYECFVRSERSELKRLKTLSDIKRPEYKHLTVKHLREQASRIIKKNLIADVIINQPTNLDEETFQQTLPSDPLTTTEKTTQNNDHNHESLDHWEETIQDSSNNYERLDHEEDIAEENNNASSSQTLSDDEQQQL